MIKLDTVDNRCRLCGRKTEMYRAYCEHHSKKFAEKYYKTFLAIIRNTEGLSDEEADQVLMDARIYHLLNGRND